MAKMFFEITKITVNINAKFGDFVMLSLAHENKSYILHWLPPVTSKTSSIRVSGRQIKKSFINDSYACIHLRA
jgi:hypothetical protein